MTLFVSNPSRQQVEFHYRTAITKDTSSPQVAIIPYGCQVEIGWGWTPEQQAYVIEQIERAGGAAADVAKGIEKFTGLLYREARPVSVEEIEIANEKVEEDAQDRSIAQAMRGVAAFDRVANQNQGKQKGRLARSTTVEVIQEMAPHEHRTGKEVEFSLTVDPEGRSDIRVPGL